MPLRFTRSLTLTLSHGEGILLESKNQQRRTGWVMEMGSNLVPNPVRLGKK
jgi:hypothetical protein